MIDVLLCALWKVNCYCKQLREADLGNLVGFAHSVR